MDLIFSEACERNKGPILEILLREIRDRQGKFLEIGHGTGQHAEHFSPFLKNIHYYACDQQEYHPQFTARMQKSGLKELVSGPYQFYAYPQAVENNLPNIEFDFIFSANTLHIMSKEAGLSTLNFISQKLSTNGVLFLYGPFKFSGQFTSDSNHRFDLYLKKVAPHQGIRDYEEIEDFLKKSGIKKKNILNLPSNNNLLVFEKI